MQYARNHGLYLFPVKPDKTPATAHGFKDATNDPEVLAKMFASNDRGMGVHPGRSGYVVVDIDVKGGAEGDEEWHSLGVRFDGPTVHTPSGGRHLWYRKPEGVVFDNTSLDTAIDIRGDNGYVILPESFKYVWDIGNEACRFCDFYHPFLEAAPLFPTALMDRLQVAKVFTPGEVSNGPIPSGSRHEAMFRLGSKLRFEGVPRDGIEASMRAMNRDRCQPPLSEQRMRAEIAGVFSAEAPINPTTGATAPEKGLIRIRERGTAFPSVKWGDFWHKDYETPTWLVQPIVVKGEITSIYAPAGWGKSEFVLYMMVKAAMQGVKVLSLDREMNAGMLRERLASFGYDNTADLTNFNYVLYPDIPPLDTEEGGYVLAEEMKNYDVCVIDSRSKFIQGDENENQTATNMHNFTMIPFRQTGKAMVVIDHAGKNVALGARGGSAIKDNVDLSLLLKRSALGTTLEVSKKRHSWIADFYGFHRFEDPIRYDFVGHDKPYVAEVCVFCGEPATTKAGPAGKPVCDDCRP